MECHKFFCAIAHVAKFAKHAWCLTSEHPEMRHWTAKLYPARCLIPLLGRGFKYFVFSYPISSNDPVYQFDYFFEWVESWNRQLVWLSFDALANPKTKRTSLKNQPLQKDVFAAAFSSWCSHQGRAWVKWRSMPWDHTGAVKTTNTCLFGPY